MPTRLTFAAMLFLPWLHGPTTDTRARIDQWSLDVRKDTFSGRIACELSSPRINYQRQSLVIHFPANIDTDDAVYRIDNGPPIQARSDLLELARLGFSVEAGGLDNPSEGLVRVPVERLDGALVIAVQPRPNARPSLFKIAGLAEALAKAEAAGCEADAFDR